MTAIETGDILLRRELPDGGLLEFEERVSGFRAYWYTAPGGKSRQRFPSVTTILGEVMPRHALLEWYEARGAAGALILARKGLLKGVEPDDAIETVRLNGLGGKATAGEAGNRGRRVHKVLEDYLLTGAVPNPTDFLPEERGYLRGLIRWILKSNPEPVEVERLVCDPKRRFAGRLDVRARVHGMSDEFIIDLKTNRRAAIYPSACIQVAAYHNADIACGAQPALGGLLVAVGPDGSFAEGYAPIEAWDVWDAALNVVPRACGALPEPLEVR
jgi:hypothetical protein